MSQEEYDKEVREYVAANYQCHKPVEKEEDNG